MSDAAMGTADAPAETTAEEKPDVAAQMLEPREYPEGQEPPELTEAEQESLDTLYETLKPEANVAYVNYFLAHTPAQFQEAMKAKVSVPS